jgi:tRNA(Ile)-lysidine synthase
MSHRHVAALDALVTDWHGQGPTSLPGGIVVGRRSGALVRVTL